MHTIDLSAADYVGTFNVRADGTVTSFAQPGGGARKPRTRSAAHTTDCLVTRADGTRYRIARNGYRPPSARKRTAVAYEPKTVTRAAPIAAASRTTDYDRRHAVGY